MPNAKASNGKILFIPSAPPPTKTENKVTANKAIMSSITAAESMIAPIAVANFFCSDSTANVIEIEVAEKTTPANMEVCILYPRNKNAIGKVIKGSSTPITAMSDDALMYLFISFKSDSSPEFNISKKIPISAIKWIK